jgi:hypothetical protein
MKRTLWSAIVALTLASTVSAQTPPTPPPPAQEQPPAPDTAELTRLLKEFLAGASRNDPAVHDRFWADELIYTGSSGRRIGKANIMADVRKAAATPAPDGRGPATVYSAEDIRIRQFGDTAIVAFRLLGTTEREGKPDVAQFLNSGTFRKRQGRWQVVNWQATRAPRPEEEVKTQAAAAEIALHRALLAADVKALATWLHDTFVWTHRTGEQVTRSALLERLSSGQLRYTKLETSGVTVSAYGDTAVVRGTSSRQRSAIPGEGSGDLAPFTIHFTLTLVNQGEGWKAVALHSSRPQ